MTRCGKCGGVGYRVRVIHREWGSYLDRVCVHCGTIAELVSVEETPAANGGAA